MKHYLYLLCLVLFSCWTEYGLARPPPPVNDLFSGVELVTVGSKELFSNTAGFSAAEYSIEFSEGSQFFVGSNSKLFTTISIYQLHEAGKLNVSALVADYLSAEDFAAFGHPDIENWCPKLLEGGDCQPVTLQNLMSMSSGIIDVLNCDYPIGSPYRDYCVPVLEYSVNRGSVASSVGLFISAPLSFVPGTSYSYSNANFQLLTYLVEKYSGLSFREYLRRNIFDVIGLQSTFYDPWNGQFQMHPNLAVGYYNYRDPSTNTTYATGRCSVELVPGAVSGTGGVVSNVPDMVKWYRALFIDRGGVLVSDESLASIVYPWTATSHGSDFYYSQGVIVEYADAASHANKWPSAILYQGGTICHSTAIVLAFSAPPTTTRRGEDKVPTDHQFSVAFRNTANYFVAKDDWERVQRQPTGTSLDILGGWERESDALVIAMDLLSYFFPATSSSQQQRQKLEFSQLSASLK